MYAIIASQSAHHWIQNFMALCASNYYDGCIFHRFVAVYANSALTLYKGVFLALLSKLVTQRQQAKEDNRYTVANSKTSSVRTFPYAREASYLKWPKHSDRSRDESSQKKNRKYPSDTCIARSSRNSVYGKQWTGHKPITVFHHVQSSANASRWQIYDIRTVSTGACCTLRPAKSFKFYCPHFCKNRPLTLSQRDTRPGRAKIDWKHTCSKSKTNNARQNTLHYHTRKPSCRCRGWRLIKEGAQKKSREMKKKIKSTKKPAKRHN